METKLKKRLKENGLFGMINNIEALYQRVTKKILVKASGVATASSNPYEISDAHKAHMLEVEIRRSKALEEARRQTARAR